MLEAEAKGRPKWASRLDKAPRGLPTVLRAKHSRRPKDTARPTAPARLEGFSPDAHMRKTRELEMESVSLPRRLTEKRTSEANTGVEFTREEVLASR